ncbi:MAG: hypothetical protein ACOY0T_03935 [Myxococcota bacterium]
MRFELGLCALSLFIVACGSSSGSLPNKYGSIALDSASEGAKPLEPRAFFYKYTSAGTGLCDAYQDDGTCRVWQCNNDAYTTLPGIEVLDAGAISVTGAKRELAFERDTEGEYKIGDFDESPLWDGGETLSASIAGSADIPVGALSLTAPPPLVVTEPVVPEEGLTIDVKNDLLISWQPLTTADAVYVAISTNTEITRSDGEVIPSSAPAVDCKFSGSTGKGVVRTSFLSLIPKPPGLKSYQLDVLTFAYDQKRVSDTMLEFRATWVGLSTNPTMK